MLPARGVVDEIRALAALKAVAAPALDSTLAALAPLLASYCELVVTASGIEIITGGVGEAAAKTLGRLARERGAHGDHAFLACARRFPDRMLGAKFCFGDEASLPTLYVRTLSARSEVLAFVSTLAEHEAAVPALERVLEQNHTLYGLGFSTTATGQPLLKTYSLADVSALGSTPRPGFVSYRAVVGEVTHEVKRYLPDLAWSELPSGFGYEDVKALVGCDRIGHLGVIESPGTAPRVKLYLERIGAIASDMSAR